MSKIIELKLTIWNTAVKSVVSFKDKETYELMQDAIKNCINKPLEYPFITHKSNNETTYFTAEYLKNSLITWSETPNPNNMPNTEKQMTACQMLINYMEESYHLTEESRLEFKQILATERQHLIGFGAKCINNVGVGFELEKHFDNTFKPNK